MPRRVKRAMMPSALCCGFLTGGLFLLMGEVWLGEGMVGD